MYAVYQTVRHRLVVGGTAGIMRNQASKVGHEDRLGSKSGSVSNGQLIDLSLSVLLNCDCVVARFWWWCFVLSRKAQIGRRQLEASDEVG